ncbi:NADPH-dependent F420 reductase [Actinomadura sp. NEAU-AAG7]|uniref:NADPH-dependent F420 reductase n=1 Tax=Actinomadura sp. NEAU-AAG7 TaxID=2839640 RepID=UPI001BE4542D|nr:NAD(P)-binding domain-containing protein [Actinomadura sp. NEAU-AAG7]MBT2213594.1 NAD(P)-binding domain-containing protein [Actinomadura sp. NEAU-AAG7]
MRIGVLGAGNMADALATRWARAGHEVRIGARTPAKAVALAERIGAGAAGGGIAEAAAFGEVVLLAVWYEGVQDVLREAGPLTGRVLIDCVNPMEPPFERLKTGEGPSVARRIADASGARVVKAFNLAHESVWRMEPPSFGGRPLGVPLCGDDPAALAAARTLVADLGCVPLDGGGLERAALLEATAAFLVGLWAAGEDPATMITPVEYAGGDPRRTSEPADA